eukprot:g3011.t1
MQRGGGSGRAQGSNRPGGASAASGRGTGAGSNQSSGGRVSMTQRANSLKSLAQQDDDNRRSRHLEAMMLLKIPPRQNKVVVALQHTVWLVFFGILAVLLWFIFGILSYFFCACGHGKTCFAIARCILNPWRKGSNIWKKPGHRFCCLHLVWMVVPGLILLVIHLLCALMCVILIVACPMACNHFRLAMLSLSPFGLVFNYNDAKMALNLKPREGQMSRMQSRASKNFWGSKSGGGGSRIM